MSIPYLQLVIQFSLSVYALHTYLDVRQLKVKQKQPARLKLLDPGSGILAVASDKHLLVVQALQGKTPPPQLAEHLTDEQYKKAQAYNIDKWYASGLLPES